MNESVDVTLEADKDSEVGDRLDAARDLVALGVICGKRIPWVLVALLDSKRNTATLFVNVEHHHLNLVAELHDFRGVDVLVGPIHFGDVYQTFDALFDFCEAAVVGEISNLGDNTATLGVAASDLYPWVLAQLLETQRHTVALAIELEDFDIHFLANFYDLARVLDTLPGHIGNVQQPVDTTEVYKRAVVGQVLDHALHGLAFLQVLQQLLALRTVGGFHHRAA